MQYRSFIKFNEISAQFFQFFEETKKEQEVIMDKIEYVMNTNILLGEQEFVANFINSKTRNKFSARDIFEIELVLNSLLDTSNPLGLSYNIKTNLLNFTGEEIKAYKETIEKNQICVEIKPENDVFITSKKQANELINSNFIIQNFTKNFLKDKKMKKYTSDKRKLKQYYQSQGIVDIEQWQKIPDTLFKGTTALGIFSISIDDLKLLYNKHLSSIKKLYNMDSFKGEFVVTTGSGKTYTHIPYLEDITVGDKNIVMRDWSLLDGLDDYLVKKNLDVRGHSYEYSNVLKQTEIKSLDNLVLLVKPENLDIILNNYINNNKEEVKRNISYLMKDAIELFFIEETIAKSDNKFFNKSLDRSDDFLLYNLLYKTHDYKYIAIEMLKKLVEVVPDFMLYIKEENIETVLSFFNNLEDRFKEEKKVFAKSIKQIDKNEIEIIIKDVTDDIRMIIFNDSAIFNLKLEGYNMSYNSDVINTISNSVLLDSSVSYKKDRIILTLFFKENLEVDLKNRYTERIKKLLTSSYQDVKKEMPQILQSEFDMLKREYDLNKRLDSHKEEQITTAKKKI